MTHPREKSLGEKYKEHLFVIFTFVFWVEITIVCLYFKLPPFPIISFLNSLTGSKKLHFMPMEFEIRKMSHKICLLKF